MYFKVNKNKRGQEEYLISIKINDMKKKKVIFNEYKSLAEF